MRLFTIFAIIFLLNSQNYIYAADRQNQLLKEELTLHSVEVIVPVFNQDSMSKPCHIRLNDPYNASIGGSGYRHGKIPGVNSEFNNLGFSLFCFDANNNYWLNGRGVKFDNKENIWIKDMENRIDLSDDIEIISLLEGSIKVENIKSVNSLGFLTTVNDITGDEEKRKQTFGFCLINKKRALCGDGRSMLLHDPRSNLLPYALEIIRSIEFVD